MLSVKVKVVKGVKAIEHAGLSLKNNVPISFHAISLLRCRQWRLQDAHAMRLQLPLSH